MHKRHQRILRILKEQGAVNVNALSEQLGVSPVTVRRDLDALDKRHIIERTHGGAILTDFDGTEFTFHQKSTMNILEKSAIGKTAAGIAKDGDVLLLNSGSTTLEIVKNLVRRDVQIVTNSGATIHLMQNATAQLFLIGGEYRQASKSFIGELAHQGLNQFYSTLTVLGINGIDVEHGLTSSVLQEAAVNKIMIERTRGSVVVVADHTKLGKVSNFMTAPITRINTLITDDQCDQQFVEALEQLGINVIIAAEDAI